MGIIRRRLYVCVFLVTLGMPLAVVGQQAPARERPGLRQDPRALRESFAERGLDLDTVLAERPNVLPAPSEQALLATNGSLALEQSRVTCYYLDTLVNSWHGANPAVKVDLYSYDLGRYLTASEYSYSYSPSTSVFTILSPAGRYSPFFWIDADNDKVTDGPFDFEWWPANPLTLPRSFAIGSGRIVPLLSPVSSYESYREGTCTGGGITVGPGARRIEWRAFPEIDQVGDQVIWKQTKSCPTSATGYIEKRVGNAVTHGELDLEGNAEAKVGVDILDTYGDYLGLSYTYPDRGGVRAKLQGAAVKVSPVADALYLSQGRVTVSATWRNQWDNTSGTARPVAQMDQYGYFWFFDAGNPELFVKVLDFGGDSYLVFHTALSDLEYTVNVTVARTGSTYTFRRPAGSVCGLVDTVTVKK